MAEGAGQAAEPFFLLGKPEAAPKPVMDPTAEGGDPRHRGKGELQAHASGGIGVLKQKQHQRKKAEAPLQIAQLEKMILLSVIDHQWNDHVDSMNRLREGIYLRSYAQIKPEDAYRQEGFERFTNMMANITDQAVLTLLHIQKREEPAPTE